MQKGHGCRCRATEHPEIVESEENLEISHQPVIVVFFFRFVVYLVQYQSQLCRGLWLLRHRLLSIFIIEDGAQASPVSL